jgi:HEAT repeat protein
MLEAILIGTAVMLLCVLLGAAFLLGRHWSRRLDSYQLSPVTRQHIELFQGGQLSEAAVERAKARLRELLERGGIEAAEATLRPGTSYVIHVRALAEIGTDEAGRILEHQLQCRLTSDVIEQSWYQIDLANGLRTLQREQSLPHLLRCAASSGDHPLSHFFAAEAVCFVSFPGYLRQPESPLGQAALRVLHRAIEGLRLGIQPQMVIEARLGEVIEDLWDHRPDSVQPLIVRIFAEAIRVLRRAPHAEVVLADERFEQEAFSWQMSRLAALESALTEYLHEAPRSLSAALPRSSSAFQREILLALADLHADSAGTVLPLLKDPGFAHAELAVLGLQWSRDPQVGPWLREWAARSIPMSRRARKRRLLLVPRQSSLPPSIPYAAVLRALRGHASSETESFLLLAARDFDPTYRAAAFSSLGWWQPFRDRAVTECLQGGRRDPNPEVRLMARAALARLGELQALQWFRHALTSQDPQRVHETIQTVASEGIFLLWPDLDHLAETENLDVALHACEALERLREQLDSGEGQ